MACEIDFNPVTLSWRSTVDNLGENVAGPDRFAALRVKREREGGGGRARASLQCFRSGH